MNFFKIAGIKWNVRVLELKESFTIMYSENTGRTISDRAKMVLDPIGTFYSHTVLVCKNGNDRDSFDNLYEYISTPRYDGMEVEIVHGQKTMKYEAYVSSGIKTIKRIFEEKDGSIGFVDYEAFEINFIPMEAQEIP